MGGKTQPKLSALPFSDEGDAIAAAEEASAPRLADVLAEALYGMGVRQAFGVVGGAIAHLAEALQFSALDVFHCRHESGAAFAAMEASFATGRPTVVFTTTGPGITNALTGLMSAKWDGARVILLSATTPPPHQGRWATQETGPRTMFAGVHASGVLCHYGETINDPSQLSTVIAALAAGCQRPQGFVASIGVPIHVQAAPVTAELASSSRSTVLNAETATSSARHCAELLLADGAQADDRHPFAIWVGFGARHASTLVRELAERTGVGVMCTPRAKGIFPEDHPQFVGVTGLGGHGGPPAYIERHRPLRTLVLGSRLGEASSMWDRRLVPEHGFVQVDVDAAAAGAYPDAPVTSVQAEIGQFLEALLTHVPTALKPHRVPPEPLPPAPSTGPLRADGPVRPTMLFNAIQRVVVDGSDAFLMAESGNSFAWAIHLLRLRTPRLRLGVSFGSMGQATTGVIGAAIEGRKSVAIVGDGAMLMFSEVNTAVQYRLPAVWVVLNDSGYGMIEHGIRRLGLRPLETAMPTTDFVALARAMGADGVRVEREGDLDAGLRQALDARSAFVIDVRIDPTEEAPIKGRVESLKKQEAAR